MQRLKKQSEYFHTAFDAMELEQQISELSLQEEKKLRILVGENQFKLQLLDFIKKENLNLLSCSITKQDYKFWGMKVGDYRFFNDLRKKALDQSKDACLWGIGDEWIELDYANLIYLKEGKYFVSSSKYKFPGIALEHLKKNLAVHEVAISYDDILNAEAVFALNSVQGVQKVVSLDGVKIKTYESANLRLKKLLDFP